MTVHPSAKQLTTAMSKEENSELNNLDQNIETLAQIQSNDNPSEEILGKFSKLLTENYKSRCFYINLINQSKPRRVNWALIFTQCFARYSLVQIITFLAAAAVLAVIQAIGLTCNSALTILVTGFIMSILMIAFAVITLKNIISALIDVKRLKYGYCSAGFLIVYERNEDDSEDNNDKDNATAEDSRPPIIAYKDSADMIRTIDFPKGNKDIYFAPAILTLFVDNANPYKVTFLDAMPLNISYNSDANAFNQSWKELKYALIPIAMIILCIISMYMSCAAFTTLNQ